MTFCLVPLLPFVLGMVWMAFAVPKSVICTITTLIHYLSTGMSREVSNPHTPKKNRWRKEPHRVGRRERMRDRWKEPAHGITCSLSHVEGKGRGGNCDRLIIIQHRSTKVEGAERVALWQFSSGFFSFSPSPFFLFFSRISCWRF